MSSYLMKSELFQYNPAFTKEKEAELYHILEEAYNVYKQLHGVDIDLATRFRKYNENYKNAWNNLYRYVSANPTALKNCKKIYSQIKSTSRNV